MNYSKLKELLKDIKSFWPNTPFLYPFKESENQRYSGDMEN